VRLPTSIERETIWRYVVRKLNCTIHYFHVLGVLTALLSEMLKDLKNGKYIRIHNLGCLKLRKTKPRRHWHVKTRTVVLSRGYKKLHFRLAKQLKKRLREELDLDKTFGDI